MRRQLTSEYLLSVAHRRRRPFCRPCGMEMQRRALSGVSSIKKRKAIKLFSGAHCQLFMVLVACLLVSAHESVKSNKRACYAPMTFRPCSSPSKHQSKSEMMLWRAHVARQNAVA